jgi:hypothetical protein
MAKRAVIAALVFAAFFAVEVSSGQSRPKARVVTRWCGVITVTDSFRLRVHNLSCPAARAMATRYLTTGNYPRGYFCAASILYCWTRGHARWFRGYPYTPPPPPPTPPPPPPPATIGHYDGHTTQNEEIFFDVTNGGYSLTGLYIHTVNQSCSPGGGIYGYFDYRNGVAPINQDGTFTIDIPSYFTFTDGTTGNGRFTMHGGFSGALAAGNLTLTTSFVRQGVTYSCSSGSVGFSTTRG